MSDSFFIGREEELRKIEQYILRSPPSQPKLQIASIWGGDGVGKTSFLNRFTSLLANENEGAVYFRYDADSKSPSIKQIFQELIDSSVTNLGDVEIYLEQLKNAEYNPTPRSGITPNSFWSQAVEEFIHNIETETPLGSSDVNLIYVIDKFDDLESPAKAAFCSFINYLSERIGGHRISVLISRSSQLSEDGEIKGFWSDPLLFALEIELKNLTREETSRWLESHDFEPAVIQKIFSDTQGHPKKVANAIKDKSLKAINEDELYSRGRNLVLQFNDFQKRWIQWAAILKFCNEESISLMTGEPEIRECMNWIRSNYPTYFNRFEQEYQLTPEVRRAIQIFVQRENPTLYRECNEKIKKFTTVRHSIPTETNRKLLSLLAEFKYFDQDLLREVFDEETARSMIQLIENKPIFFRAENSLLRLASNIRASITIYNELFSFKNREHLRTRIETLWNKKQEEISKDLTKIEKELKKDEEKNRSLTVSLNKIENEVNRMIKIHQNLSKETKQVVEEKKNSMFNLVAIGICQFTGIAILYTNVLVFEKLNITYLILAIFFIVGGFFISTGKRGRKRVVSKKVDRSDELVQLEQFTENLKMDQSSLLAQKEKIRTQIEKSKVRIIQLQNTLKQPYPNES